MQSTNSSNTLNLTVERMTLFNQEGEPEKGGVAAVNLVYGGAVIRARLTRGSQGLFLSMPSRKGSDDKWWDQAYFSDAAVLREFERLAIERYHALKSEQELEALAA